MKTTSKELNHVFFMLIKTTVASIAPIFKKNPSVAMRFFDSEAFSGRYTDVLMWETSEVKDYQFIVEELRETLFWGTYFEIVEIVPAIENAYALYYEVDSLSSPS
jgi:Darcynin, domain of unknown function